MEFWNFRRWDSKEFAGSNKGSFDKHIHFSWNTSTQIMWQIKWVFNCNTWGIPHFLEFSQVARHSNYRDLFYQTFFCLHFEIINLILSNQFYLIHLIKLIPSNQFYQIYSINFISSISFYPFILITLFSSLYFITLFLSQYFYHFIFII